MRAAPVRMSHVDAAWLGMESPDNLMMVTAVLHLAGPVDRDRLSGVLRDRLLGRYPKFAQRPLPSARPFEQPVWTDDPDFRLDRHVVDAGRRAGDADLRAYVGELLGQPLDMTHSPWQFHLLELDPGSDATPGGTVIVARLHHCIGDGIALAGVLLSLTDDSPEPDRAGHPDRPPVPPRSLRSVAASVRLAWGVLTTGLGLLFAARDPRTRLSGRLGPLKGAAWTRSMELDGVKSIARALDATVNDVLLAVTAGALRRHLLDHGDRAHDLRVFVPVDLRPKGQPVPADLGNRFGLVFVRLPVAEADPVARVRLVRERMGVVKAGPQAVSTYALLAVVGALPSWGHRLAVRLLGAKSTAVVTNVPGPREPVFLAGSRLSRLVFWVPQAGSVGLGVSILSYAGEVVVGVAADRNLVPDPSRLSDAIEAELDDLARLVRGVAGGVSLQEVEFGSAQAQSLVAEVQQEYVRRYGGPDTTPVDPDEFAPPGGTFLVASVDGEAVGCAGVRRHHDGVAEVKRMYVRPAHRRRGHARRMLSALEAWARDSGYTRVVLETGVEQPEAIALYLSAGYRPVDGFGHYKDAPLSRSFARDL